MPAPANLSMKPTRASFARMLAHITMGLAISTGAAFVAGPAHSQSCDRCAGLKPPTCGCEYENRIGPKQWYCKCVPKPSLGEQLLSHFDKVGDRIEAKAKKHGNGHCDHAARSRYNLCPTCGCESPQDPSCGCEFNSVQSSRAVAPFQYSPSQNTMARPFPSDPNRFAIGSIGDKHIDTPVHSDQFVKTPVAPAPDPTMQRIPFEQRTNKPELTDLSDPPPAWAPDSKPPQETNPITPEESTLPDVLVDPFKDDASFRGTRQKMEGILLTSNRPLSAKDLRFAPSNRVAEEESTPIKPKKPSRLSPSKRSGPNLQFEATESASSDGSQVVPSNFFEESKGRVIVRKEMPKRYSDEMPLVPRMRVPTKH